MLQVISVALLAFLFAGIAGIALYKIVRFFRKDQPRYTYTLAKDEDGNDIEAVIAEE